MPNLNFADTLSLIEKRNVAHAVTTAMAFADDATAEIARCKAEAQALLEEAEKLKQRLQANKDAQTRAEAALNDAREFIVNAATSAYDPKNVEAGQHQPPAPPDAHDIKNT